jgi:hypothetical protein
MKDQESTNNDTGFGVWQVEVLTCHFTATQREVQNISGCSECLLCLLGRAQEEIRNFLRTPFQDSVSLCVTKEDETQVLGVDRRYVLWAQLLDLNLRTLYSQNLHRRS